MNERAKNQSMIFVQDSVFENLNYGKVLHGLGSKDKKINPFGESKGIVCTLIDFGGKVEFHNNTINKNMVFIPSAIFTNL